MQFWTRELKAIRVPHRAAKTATLLSVRHEPLMSAFGLIFGCLQGEPVTRPTRDKFDNMPEGVDPYPDADAQRVRLKRDWPDEFRDGARCGFLQRCEGKRERGGFPLGFHQWPHERRNGWYAGFNRGWCDRRKTEAG
jgi:hypothetical protein